MFTSLAVVAMTVAFAGLSAGGVSGQAAQQGSLRLNDVQVIGSHNSYRSNVAPQILAYLDQTRHDASKAFNYGNPPLPRQLDIGVRQIEIDTFADPDGGRFAEPPGEKIAPGGFDRSAMLRPGYKVMHIPGLDYHTNCSTLILCLTQVRQWSEAHPRHLPIFITIDAKDYAFHYPGAIVPLHLSAALLDALDAEIRSVMPMQMLITPDEVRGSYPTLRDAVLADNWPTLESARGKIMFIFDVRRQTADTYRSGHPSLTARVMFSLYPEGDPEAATFIIQNPRGKEEWISNLVREGFIVRTRSDEDTREGHNLDYSGFRAAERSGAQMISTDFYPGAPDPQHLHFHLSFKHSALARCNPVRQPRNCVLDQN